MPDDGGNLTHARMMETLPVENCLDAFLELRSRGVPVVVSSPTGSGKSTRVPLWARRQGRVLVVEPRRVVAKALAFRIAEETGTRPGELAGWKVRGDSRGDSRTDIVFVTPGVALRMIATGELEGYGTVILDEFHERRSDVDALLAWMRWKGEIGRTVVLSATLDARALADEIGAEVLVSEGRAYPVDIEYRGELGQTWPVADGLPLRLERALRSLDSSEGTVLVFLPGTGEIADCAAWLDGRIPGMVRELHGGMPLEAQQEVLHPADGLRIVLSTNVAESALTVPDVRAVVDSGLERRIVRAGGFPSLELQPISKASADQRAGRAGRTGPGRCLRLWASSARLETRPRPGIQVDDPDDWLLPVLAAGADPWSLPWLDKPRSDQLREALDRFRRVGIWCPDPWDPSGGQLTERGSRVLDLPLPPDLAGVVLSLEETPAFRDMAALACALAQARPLLAGRPSPDRMAVRERIAGAKSDLALLSRIVRLDADQARAAGAKMVAWREAREDWDRVADRLGISQDGWPADFQSDSVVKELFRLEPKSLRVRRGAAGREEFVLGEGAGLRPSSSSLAFVDGAPELVLAVSTHGGIDVQGKRRVWIDAAEPLGKARALRLELGRVEIAQARRSEQGVRAQWKLRAGSVVLGSREDFPEDPRVWAGSVVEACPEADLEAIQQRLDEAWLERCSKLGTWIAPPEDAAGWLVRILEMEHRERGYVPPVWPDPLPMPAGANDPDSVKSRFPDRIESAGGIWQVRWNVRTGRVRLKPSAGKLGGAPTLPASKGWTVKIDKT